MKRFCLLIIVAIFSFSLIGCSGDQKYSGEEFIGTWKAYESTLNEDKNLLDDNIITIQANGDVTQTLKGIKYKGEIDSVNSIGEISIRFDNSDDACNFYYDSLSDTLNQTLEDNNILLFESLS